MKVLFFFFFTIIPLLSFCQSNSDQQPAKRTSVAPPPPPPPPPPPEPKVEEIFKIVAKMPRFPGCENFSGSETQKDSCAHAKMTHFVQQNIKYPVVAERHKIEGTVQTSFVIEKDGRMTNIKIEKGIGYGCDREALRVLKLIPEKGIRWTPQGGPRGRALRILFKFDIEFRLE